MKIDKYCISKNNTVRDAMKKMDIIKPKILFLEDNGYLIGSLTDGDIRRYLYNSGKIDDLVEKAVNINTKVAINEAEAKKLYNAKNYIAIPIVDSEKKIKDIFVGQIKYDEQLAKLNVPVVINAGGKGTRLEPFTKVLPKPLIPVGDLPIIEHIMKQFNCYGCNSFHVIVNYKKELLKAYFSDDEIKYDIDWYNEEKPLGTGGGLSLLKDKVNETFFFTNCDILLQSDYESMLKFHKENRNSITMICAYKNICIPYGVIDMGPNGSIKEMKEKPELSFLTNTGMYIVEPEVLYDIEPDTSIGFPEIIDNERRKGKNVAIYPVSEYEWMDMGQMSELEKMRERLYGE